MEIANLRRILSNEAKEKSDWTMQTIIIARKAIITGLVMAVLFVYSGVTPMMSYTGNIFQETGSNLSPNMSAIVIGKIKNISSNNSNINSQFSQLRFSCLGLVLLLNALNKWAEK